MTTRAAARQRQRRVNARWRAAALPGSYTTFRDTTRAPAERWLLQAFPRG